MRDSTLAILMSGVAIVLAGKALENQFKGFVKDCKAQCEIEALMDSEDEKDSDEESEEA